MSDEQISQPSILCFGAMHMDKLARCLRPFMRGVSNPVSSDYAVGGVAFNIARNLKLRGCHVGMVSRIGDDPDGRYVKDQSREWKIENDLVVSSSSEPTATYTAILDNDGELAAGLSEMDIYDHVSVNNISAQLDAYRAWPYWVVDANLPSETLQWLGQNKGESKLLSAPVSVAKAERWNQALKDVDIWIGNGTEATILSGVLVNDIASAKVAAEKLCSLGPSVAVVTLAGDGVVIWSKNLAGHWSIPPTNVRDVNGAGDSFFAGFSSSLAKGKKLEQAVITGISVASLTAENDGPVSLDLTDKKLHARMALVPTPSLD